MSSENLKTKLPRLNSLSTQKFSYILDLGLWDGYLWRWNFQWRRLLFQSEIGEVDALMDIVNGIQVFEIRCGEVYIKSR